MPMDSILVFRQYVESTIATLMLYVRCMWNCSHWKQLMESKAVITLTVCLKLDFLWQWLCKCFGIYQSISVNLKLLIHLNSHVVLSIKKLQQNEGFKSEDWNLEILNSGKINFMLLISTYVKMYLIQMSSHLIEPTGLLSSLNKYCFILHMSLLLVQLSFSMQLPYFL